MHGSQPDSLKHVFSGYTVRSAAVDHQLMVALQMRQFRADLQLNRVALPVRGSQLCG